jgi:hypothetical protein
VEAWAKKAKTFDKLPEGIGERNLVLSGRYIGSSDSPRDYLAIDPPSLVDNLVTCRAATASYKLNSDVFMDLIHGVTPDVIEKALKAVRITNWENVVGKDSILQSTLGTQRTVDAVKEIAIRLKKLSRWRNNWAHGGDEEVSLTLNELSDEVNFLAAYCRALDSAVSRQVANFSPH